MEKDQIHRQLGSILASDGFASAPKLQRFLRYVVEQSLAGLDEEIKESVIGFEVYQKPASYDPRLDATVRVEASKLRTRLDHYYESAAGATAPVRISIPKGSYVPKFEQIAPPTIRVLVAPIVKAPANPRWWAPASIALIALVAGGLLGWLAGRNNTAKDDSAPGARFSQISDLGSFATEPDLSPDGSFVVYSSDRQNHGVLNLWRQPVEGGEPVQVTRLANPARTPTISASGKQVVFRLEESGGMLAVVSPDGGEVTQIRRARRARHPRFAPSGERVAYWVPQDEQTLDHGSVFVIDMNDPGADPTRAFGEFAHASQPVWHAGGGQLLAVGTWQSSVPEKEYDAWTIEAAPDKPPGAPQKTGLFPLLESRGLFRTTAERAKVQVGEWRNGWLYFSAPSGDGDNLFRVRLEPGRKVRGEPEAVTAGAGGNSGVRAGARRMVFANAMVSYGLYSAPLPGSPGSLTRLTHGRGVNMRVSVDRSGLQAAWERRLSGGAGSQLWVLRLDSGAGRELGAGTVAARSSVLLSPDGRTAAYQVLENTKQAIYLESLAGGSPPRRVCTDCGIPSDWNTAGTHLLYTTGGRPNGIGLLDIGAGRGADLLNHPSYGLYGARYDTNAAGDGWMALYADTGPRTRQIFVAPVKNHRPAAYQDWIAITDGAHWDLSPAWGPDGHSIFFVSQRDGYRCIWVQALTPGTRRPLGGPQPVHHFHGPEQTLMSSVTNRGADVLWLAAGKLFFSLDQTTSSLWLKE